MLVDDLLAEFYAAAPEDPLTLPMAAVLGVAEPAAWVRPPDDAERLIILQYTSGSTSEPKGVMIPDRVLRANMDASCEAAGLSLDEVMVSWLPLYHDMGLVGFLSIPMTRGVQLVQAARRTSWPSRGTGCSGSVIGVGPRRRARTSPGCWRRGRSSGCTTSICPR